MDKVSYSSWAKTNIPAKRISQGLPITQAELRLDPYVLFRVEPSTGLYRFCRIKSFPDTDYYGFNGNFWSTRNYWEPVKNGYSLDIRMWTSITNFPVNQTIPEEPNWEQM